MNIDENIDPDDTYLTADGFEAAMIGIAHPWQSGHKPVAVYDLGLCIEILVEQGMDEDEAYEHFEFNVAGSYVGEQTPIFGCTCGAAKNGYFERCSCD